MPRSTELLGPMVPFHGAGVIVMVRPFTAKVPLQEFASVNALLSVKLTDQPDSGVVPRLLSLIVGTWPLPQSLVVSNSTAQVFTSLSTSVAVIVRVAALAALRDAPPLAADSHVQALGRSLTQGQATVDSARERYRQALAAYNDGIQHLPRGLAARLLGYEERPDFVRYADAGR